MRFGGDVQCAVKAPGKIGLERGEAICVAPFVPPRPPRETIEFPAVASESHHGCAAPRDRHPLPIPPVGGLTTEPEHRLLRRFTLADSGQHAPRPPRTAVRPRPGRGIEDCNFAVAGDKLCRHAETGDTGAKDARLHVLTSRK